MVVWSFLWHCALCHIPFLHVFTLMSIACIIRFGDMILSVVQHSIMRYRTWSIRGWSTWLGPMWPPILCLRILHMQSLLLLIFIRLIWMLMVLLAYGISGFSRVEDLDQSTWVHHLVAVRFGAFSFWFGYHQSHFHFVEFSFQFVRVVFVLLSPVFGLGSLFLVSCWESSFL